ncbi:hypothetical protein PLICRDRAFT_44870 [Plicaturopsis crispa FD-325 SS-3]|nr:hypothetical protein PLICRDRAFT_44870 [Plicaturopsis crispa FD-325 SS-3]
MNPRLIAEASRPRVACLHLSAAPSTHARSSSQSITLLTYCYTRSAATCRYSQLWQSSFPTLPPRKRVCYSKGESSTRPYSSSTRGSCQEISDREWELRTGRAIDILRETLPTFFHTGLVGAAPTSSSAHAHSSPSEATHAQPSTTDADEERIYDTNIRLVYTPPLALPPPFPRSLKIEGLPLYAASAVFVRYTLAALYGSLRVSVRKVVVRSGGGPDPDGGGLNLDPPNDASAPKGDGTRKEKRVFVALTVHGFSRVSRKEGEWDVNSTYTLSPVTGRITLHTVDSICPAPHESVWAGLIGLGGGGGMKGAAGAANCEGASSASCTGTGEGDDPRIGRRRS